MLVTKKQELVETLISPVVEAMGYEWIGSELQPQGKQVLLRFYIDRPGGVTIQDCEDVSRHVSTILDTENPIQTTYILEVSSPGINRPLFNLSQFKQFVGEKAQVHLYAPIDQRRNVLGQIGRVDMDTQTITLVCEGVVVEVLFENISKAHLIREKKKEGL
jgi:ribosome maturation factor RimP